MSSQRVEVAVPPYFAHAHEKIFSSSDREVVTGPDRRVQHVLGLLQGVDVIFRPMSIPVDRFLFFGFEFISSLFSLRAYRPFPSGVQSCPARGGPALTSEEGS